MGVASNDACKLSVSDSLRPPMQAHVVLTRRACGVELIVLGVGLSPTVFLARGEGWMAVYRAAVTFMLDGGWSILSLLCKLVLALQHGAFPSNFVM